MAQQESPFVLRHLVRDVLAQSDEADPGQLADLVLARIVAGDRDAALAQTMRLFVRQVISETRISRGKRNVSSLRPRTGSSKVSAIREGWQRHLRDRVHVGPGEWKQLRDCTYEDLIAAATERQEHADRNAAWAREYRAMASAVLEADVDRFGDLPAATQMTMLGGAA